VDSGHELSALRSARVLTPHNRSQHIQANGVLYSLAPDDGHNDARNMLS